MPEQIRYAQLFWELMQTLRDAPESLSPTEVFDRVREPLQPTSHELERVKSGGVRWEIVLRFQSGEAVTVGWMTKRDGWAITEAGLAAMEAFPDPVALDSERYRRYREIDEQRKRAQRNLSEVQQFIAQTLRLVEAGSWTAQDDLAELAGTTGEEVAHFLANPQVKLANGYRVLNADGSVPDEGMTNAAYRGTDLQRRLAAEGVKFNEFGRAPQDQRLGADILRTLLEEQAEDNGSTGADERRHAGPGWSADPTSRATTSSTDGSRTGSCR